MYYFIEIACVIAEMWIVHMFLSSYYDKRNCSILQMLGMYGIFGAIIAVLSLVPDLSFVRLAVTFLGIWVTALVLLWYCLMPRLSKDYSPELHTARL